MTPSNKRHIICKMAANDFDSIRTVFYIKFITVKQVNLIG